MITSYERMPVGIYERLQAIAEDKELDVNAANLATVAVLTGKSEAALLDEPLGKWRQQIDAAGFLLVLPHPAKVRKVYRLGLRRYRPTLEARKMTAGQYIDFQEYAKEGGERWVEVLSVLLVPEGKTYGNGYDIAEVQEAIRQHLCILDAIALRAFFLTSSAALDSDTRRSLAAAMRQTGTPRRERRAKMRTIRQAEKALRSAGAGWRTLTQWLNLPDALGTK